MTTAIIPLSVKFAPVTPADAVSPAIAHLQQVLAGAGWEIDFIDVDLTGEKPVAVIKCHRYDGRWLWAKVDALGRCSVETFHRERWLGKPSNSKGNWPLSPQVDDVFLGRVRPANPGALLEHISGYIANNSLQPVIQADIQEAWRALMVAPALKAA